MLRDATAWFIRFARDRRRNQWLGGIVLGMAIGYLLSHLVVAFAKGCLVAAVCR
jgi:hypothetical protein